MATTTNFNWETPDDTDLVKDGAAAIRTALSGVDTSFVDLKGGTTGQVLAKASNTDLDFVWSADAAGMTNPMTTTGDTIYSSSGSTPARLGIGTTGQVLTVSGGVPTWATAGAAENYALIGSASLSGATTITISGISGKNNLYVYASSFSTANASSQISVRMNSDSTSKYSFIGNGSANTAVKVDWWNNDSSWKIVKMGNDQGLTVHAALRIGGCNSSGFKPMTFAAAAEPGTGSISLTGVGHYSGTSTISSISFISSSGNFDAGTLYVYGA